MIWNGSWKIDNGESWKDDYFEITLTKNSNEQPNEQQRAIMSKYTEAVEQVIQSVVKAIQDETYEHTWYVPYGLYRSDIYEAELVKFGHTLTEEDAQDIIVSYGLFKAFQEYHDIDGESPISLQQIAAVIMTSDVKKGVEKIFP